MRQCLEVGARLRIGKHDVAQRGAVEVAVGGEDRRAEALDQSLERRLAGLHDVAGDLIAVEDGHAERAEELRRRGLAAGDAAGQPDADTSGAHGVHAHGCSEPMQVARNDLRPAHQYQPAGGGEKRTEGNRRRAVLPAQREHRRCPRRPRRTAAIRMIGSSICQPSHAPSAAKQLEVTVAHAFLARDAAGTDDRRSTGSRNRPSRRSGSSGGPPGWLRGWRAPQARRQSPIHSSGSVRLSGSSWWSMSMKVSAIRNQVSTRPPAPASRSRTSTPPPPTARPVSSSISG